MLLGWVPEYLQLCCPLVGLSPLLFDGVLLSLVKVFVLKSIPSDTVLLLWLSFDIHFRDGSPSLTFNLQVSLGLK